MLIINKDICFNLQPFKGSLIRIANINKSKIKQTINDIGLYASSLSYKRTFEHRIHEVFTVTAAIKQTPLIISNQNDRETNMLTSNEEKVLLTPPVICIFITSISVVILFSHKDKHDGVTGNIPHNMSVYKLCK